MTIGIYGGSFDPIHTGHAVVANFVAQCGLVDEVWITVAKQNPLKTDRVLAHENQRITMAEIVASLCSGVRVCDIEMELPHPSYTINTLNELKRRFEEYDFRLIIGSDSYRNFERWKSADEIRQNYGLIVYPRPGYPLPKDEPGNTVFLNGAPEFSISSSLIREYCKSRWNINYFVPPQIAQYIINHNLYL